MEKQYRDNAFSILVKEQKDLQSKVQHLSGKIDMFKGKIERIQQSISLTKQQIEFFGLEVRSTFNLIFNCTESILRRYKDNLVNLNFKVQQNLQLVWYFLVLINQGAVIQEGIDLGKFRYFLDNTQLDPQNLEIILNYQPEGKLWEELIGFWKSKGKFKGNSNPGIRALADWIGYFVEYKIKVQTLSTSLEKHPYQEEKMRKYMKDLQQYEQDLLNTNKRLLKLNELLFLHTDSDQDLSVISMKYHRLQSKISSNEPERQGIMKIGSSSITQEQFPNFEQPPEELYVEDYNQESILMMEESREAFGCCQGRFFCF